MLRLALPALATLVAEPVYVLTDTAIVGHLGTDELAGLALASTVLITGYSIFLFLAYGTTASVSRLLGAKQDREAARHAVQGLWLAVFLGVALSVAGFFGGDALITVLGGRGVVAANAGPYLRISVFGFPALLVGLACHLPPRLRHRSVGYALAKAIGRRVNQLWLRRRGRSRAHFAAGTRATGHGVHIGPESRRFNHVFAGVGGDRSADQRLGVRARWITASGQGFAGHRETTEV